MAEWHVAKSLDALLREYNELFPNRPKGSDGALGNASHQAAPSDHNPDYRAGGVVRARDFATQIANGTKEGRADQAAGRKPLSKDQVIEVIDDLIQTEINNPVDRIWYIIHMIPGESPKIWSRTTGWQPRRYTGGSPHDHHFHVSLMHTKAAENDIKPWFTKLRSTGKDDELPSVKDIFNEDDTIPQENGEITGNPKNAGTAFKTAVTFLHRKVNAIKAKTDRIDDVEARLNQVNVKVDELLKLVRNLPKA